jgi:phosphoribosylformimino-5-aminoimidazole carboxamide ribotide isomerase
MTALKLWPSIDLKDGSVVRLLRGELANVTVYDASPAAVARRFAEEGADGIHVVDLDAAFGRGENGSVVREIVRAAGSVPVQVGGGVRSLQAVEALFAAGVGRVVLGSLPFTAPAEFEEIAAKYPARVVVALDCKDGRPSIRGWTEDAGAGTLADAVPPLVRAGIGALLVTDVSKDGAMEGPGRALLAEARRCFAGEVIASGGIRGEEDLPAVEEVLAGGPCGVILGRALHDGRTSVARLRAALARGGGKWL